MSVSTIPDSIPVITDEQHAIARTYVIENLDELLCWSDLTDLLEEPFVRPERDHPSEREVRLLARIEGIPLRYTLRLDDDSWANLSHVGAGSGRGAAELLALLSA